MKTNTRGERRLDFPAKWALIVALFASVTDRPAIGQEAKSEPKTTSPTLTAEQIEKNVASFDVVWTTIRDTHYDPKLGGIDWQKARDEIRPKAEKATNMDEARAAIREMIDRLNLSHFGIIPAEVYQELENSKGGPGELGINLRVVDNQAVVTSILEGSTAAAAGVKPGWIIDRVDKTDTKDIFSAVEKAFKNQAMLLPRKATGVMSQLHGTVGKSASIDFRDSTDQKVHLDIPFGEPIGVKAKFGNLPDFHVRYESKHLDGSIGYVSLNIFFDLSRVLEKFAESIAGSQDAEGLIIDLRGNPGGIGAMAIGMGGWLVTEPDQKLGHMITRDGSLNFALNPRSAPYEGPVAVIVDELSMSTSEILAGGLQDLKRARIFGTKTPGAALPSRFDVLPNGDRFQHAFANYISEGGKPLEGVGVTPDVVTPLNIQAIREGRDQAVEAAIAWIRSRRSKS